MFSQILETPIGLLYLSATGEALTECRRLLHPDSTLPISPNAMTQQAAAQLREYFSGTRKEFTIRLAPKGTPFQQSVWSELLRVGFGRKTEYGLLAQRLQNPRACRAVGGAVGKNPLLIFIPCHRVLAGSGRLGGFSAGLDAKKYLLRLENIGWMA